jgi:hypothetical protein
VVREVDLKEKTCDATRAFLGWRVLAAVGERTTTKEGTHTTNSTTTSIFLQIFHWSVKYARLQDLPKKQGTFMYSPFHVVDNWNI